MKFTLKTKLLAFLFLIFSLIFGLSAWFSSTILKEETSRGYEERYEKMVLSYATRVETILNAGTHLADQMASVIARSSLLPDEELHELLTGIIKLDTVLFAAGVAFEPYKYSTGRHHFGYFIYQSAGVPYYRSGPRFPQVQLPRHPVHVVQPPSGHGKAVLESAVLFVVA